MPDHGAVAGEAVSKVAGALEAAVVRSVGALSRIAAEGARAGVNTAAACAPSLRTAFFGAFTAFAVAMDKVPHFTCATQHVPHRAGRETGNIFV